MVKNKLAGIIFGDSYDVDLKEMLEMRTLAGVPFGARYRVIDFLLSNMVNAGIKNIGVITTQKYLSLMKHVSAGAPWDLDRKNSGLTFLPPFNSESIKTVYENRLEALQANISWLSDVEEEYILITGCNYVGNLDFSKMLEAHEKSGAMITALYTRHFMNKKDGLKMTEFDVEEGGVIKDCRIATELIQGMDIGLNAYIMKTADLVDCVEKTIREGQKSFRRNILMPAISHYKVLGYEAKEEILFLDDISCYLKSSMALLDKDVRDSIFAHDDRPVMTKVKDSPPTRYGDGAVVENSIIADGVIVEGTVKNSIIFRGAVIGKGAVVENSVVMHESNVGENCHLNYAVVDKKAAILGGRTLSGYITHPFYVEHDGVV